ncbi:hypothetical protein ACFC8F_23380, partial [Streptomyces hydrogenans]|uniref:hypothetical protein n=1 Tax=Streptomyces hydrogenans TaxID=1873719 RepID=UPI0035DDB9E6
GVGGDIGAKTGSAEVDNQKKPNAWFTAYRDDPSGAAPFASRAGVSPGPGCGGPGPSPAWGRRTSTCGAS